MNSKLREVKGKLLPNIPPKDKPLEINVKHHCHVELFESGLESVLSLETTVGPSPEALFEIHLSHKIHAEWQDKVSIDQVKKEAFTLCASLGNQISYITGFLSYELIGTHIIIPPHLNKDSFLMK